MRKLTLAILLLALACAPSKGTVRDKNFSPAHSELRMQIMSDGKNTTIIPVTDYYPNQWSLLMEDCSDESKKDRHGNVKCKRGWKSVSSGMYEDTEIGDYLDFDTGNHVRVKSRYVQTLPPKGSRVVDRDYRLGE